MQVHTVLCLVAVSEQDHQALSLPEAGPTVCGLRQISCKALAGAWKHAYQIPLDGTAP